LTRGEAAEAAARQAAFEAAAGALLLLRRDEMLEELGGAPAPFGGEGDDIVEVRGGVPQAEAVSWSARVVVIGSLLRPPAAA